MLYVLFCLHMCYTNVNLDVNARTYFLLLIHSMRTVYRVCTDFKIIIKTLLPLTLLVCRHPVLYF